MSQEQIPPADPCEIFVADLETWSKGEGHDQQIPLRVATAAMRLVMSSARPTFVLQKVDPGLSNIVTPVGQTQETGPAIPVRISVPATVTGVQVEVPPFTGERSEIANDIGEMMKLVSTTGERRSTDLSPTELVAATVATIDVLVEVLKRRVVPEMDRDMVSDAQKRMSAVSAVLRESWGFKLPPIASVAVCVGEALPAAAPKEKRRRNCNLSETQKAAVGQRMREYWANRKARESTNATKEVGRPAGGETFPAGSNDDRGDEQHRH